MGLSLSCLHYVPLYARLSAAFWNLMGLNHGKTNSNGQMPILRALGSGKMLIERSLSLKRGDGDKKDGSMKSASFKSLKSNSDDSMVEPATPEGNSPKHQAAIKLQKVYKSFRTRRQLADCAVLVEQHWWKLLDFALLESSSVSFFDHNRPETVISRWSRARKKAAKVGKGLSKDTKAQKLALQHWLEAIDPRHRYGHNLHFYYHNWLSCESKQPFFYWLDVGEGKEVNIPNCPRSKLQLQCIKYLGPVCPLVVPRTLKGQLFYPSKLIYKPFDLQREREAYEVIVEDGKLVYKQNGKLLDTSNGPQDLKWIFVLSTSRLLYVGQKRKGRFQHSSFLAGGATSSAGRLEVKNGILKAVWPHSGHYRPTEENFLEFVSFLKENNVDLTDVKKDPVDDEGSFGRSGSSLGRMPSGKMSSKHLKIVMNENINDERYSDIQQPSEHDEKMDVSAMLFEESSHCSSNSLESRVVCDGFNAMDIQNIYKGSEGETDEDSDDNAGSIEQTTEYSDLSETSEESSHPNFLTEAPQRSDQGLEVNSSSIQSYMFHKKNLFEEDQNQDSEQQPIPKELILQRINTIKRTNSFQLGRKWTSGVGPRIGCVRVYPSQLQFQALEQVHLSPRTSGHSPSTCSTPRTTEGSTLQASGGHSSSTCSTPRTTEGSTLQASGGHSPSTCSTPRTTEGSTLQAARTSLWKHHSIDSCYCT